MTASTFRVWDPDNCDEKDGSDVAADTVWEAAESYVAARSDYLADNCDEVNVLVRMSDGDLYEVCVGIEHEVSYHASTPQRCITDPYASGASESTDKPGAAEPEPRRLTACEIHTRTHEDDR